MTLRPRIAIAHDYLTQRGGAEKVVLAMARAFPEAPIYTTLYESATTFPEFAGMDIRTSPLNKIAVVRQHHRAGLPVLPFAASAMKIDADLVLVSSSGWAHGFRTTGRKLVYCYTPARWLYQTRVYLGDTAPVGTRLVAAVLTRPLRAWDRRAARSADRYLAISSAVRERIHAVYGIDASVLPAPPSAVTSLPVQPVDELRTWAGGGDFYLCIARLLAYKNVDTVISAFAGGPRNLVIVGAGPQEPVLRRLATDHILMVKNLTDAQMRWLYQHCRAVISAAYEDYGLTPLEGAGFGKPSVLLRWGGFLDTMVEGVTCVYFEEPDPTQIAAAVDQCEAATWDPDAIAGHVEKLDEAHFARALHGAVDQLLAAGPDPAPLPREAGRP
ncbi:glycosyltransferase [Rhodococcus tibetensis]|uniref:Glycosyltransferase n=1 Tax=Rhodococcus tibetensis TaxID=2965064 RepID=A0ABT1QFD5_9NOCA|nr:glycosyltransferase [Rhodococcus sp. FXJ9.536]MCQ4120902.1 glycosyltransferase [Rhodococcus sp. FXJ9.536]